MQEANMTDESTVQRSMLMGESDYEAAIAAVVALAESTLHIFDPDLVLGGYAGLQRFETLQKFLLGNTRNRLVMILHDTGYLTARCPRLMNLLRMHSHAIAIHQTQEHGRVANDPFVIADEMHYVHRFHRDNARALLALHDPSGARELEGRFQQLLEASHPAVFATTLGL